MKMSEKALAYHKKYREEHREHRNAWQKVYSAKYREQNREQYRERNREWHRLDRKKRPEFYREQRRKWNEAHKKEIQYYDKERRKFKHKFSLRFRIFMRDNFTCRYCGRNVKEDGVRLELDHVFPRSMGGKDSEDNYFTACKECNIGKLNKIIPNEVLNSL